MKMKETLNLGKTKFPMRGNLPNKEGERQKLWEEEKLYERQLKQNEGHEQFILHDGPPYANGNIHIGHAMNKISKDIINRQKMMTGYQAPFVPGWDTHGLPIEQAVTNSGVDRKAMTTAEFRKICEQYAWEQIESQREDFKRLGIQGNWEKPYVTFAPEYEEAQLRLFGRMVEEGLIYKGYKPVFWSPSSESTLAEAEVEYKDIASPSLYLAFKLKDGQGLLPKETEFVVWTTTPWTIPANMALCVHPDMEYSLVAVDGRLFLLASSLLDQVSEALGWSDVLVKDTFVGQELAGLVAWHPFYDRESPLLLGEHVTADSGSGIVHTAPGHGEDDYLIGKANGLDILSPIDARGHFTEEAPGFAGMFYLKGNKAVIKKLEEVGSLLHLGKLTHSYPHDWRTKKPVIYRATPQWFCSVETIKEATLERIMKDIKWWHPSGQTRIYNMIKERGDWVISRQRVWGVPLPIFYAENGEAILDPAVIQHVASLIGEHGSNIWFDWPAEKLLPRGFSHEGSPHGEFTKEMDIMDVWFDSGSSHAGVLGVREELHFPADLYLEGSDQYRGWFNSSLLTSMAVNDEPPYRAVLSQGFVNDGEGRKMSKSIGNTVSPNDVCQQRGADILRLWVASVDTYYDVRISDDILGQVAEAYRKIRNTIRFMLGNLNDFKPAENGVAYEDLASIDQFMLVALDDLITDVKAAYDRYDFMTVYKRIINFVTHEMSSFYLDYSKDVTYIELADSPARRNMQTVMYAVVKALTLLLTPIIPHTTEEIWTFLAEPEDFAQLAYFPEVTERPQAEELRAFWTDFLAFRDEVNKALEGARKDKVIGKSLQAKLLIYANDKVKEKLAQVGPDLRTYLMVSKVEIKDLDAAPKEAIQHDAYALKVEPADGETCSRCWGVYESVGTIPEAPTLCQRCADIVLNHFPEALEGEE